MIGFMMTIIMPMMPFMSLPLSIFEFVQENVAAPFNLQTTGCEDVSNVPWSHPDLGIQARDPHHLCPPITLRHRSCCRPSLPKFINYRFMVDNGEDVISTRDFRSRTLMRAITYNQRPVVWFVPGLLSDDFMVGDVIAVSEAYVRRGFTVVLVDWDELGKAFGQSIADVRVIAAMISSMMSRSGSVDRSMCVGFSYGAHACAIASKDVKKKTGRAVPRCHMLDPAGPGFELMRDTTTRMTHGDCDVMIAIHTTHTVVTNFPISVLQNPGFGTMERLADCNFVVNDAIAYNQPGCADLTKLNQMIRRKNKRPFIQRGPPAQRCGHARALALYLSSLEESCNMMGTKELGKSMRLPPFDTCDHGKPQTFHVNTTMALKPYC